MAELSDNLVPRFKDLAEPHRVKPVGLVIRNCLFFYLLIQREHLKSFTWKGASLATQCLCGGGRP
jgi:hypothetical protein